MPNKEMHLILDFDRTLFDVASFLTTIHYEFQTSEVFSPNHFPHVQVSQEQSQRFLFPDTAQTLTQWQDQKITMWIFSQGDLDGQAFKYQIAGINQWIPPDRQFTYSDYKIDHIGDILSNIPKHSTIMYIDDKATCLSDAKQLHPQITTILVLYHHWEDQTVNNPPDITINTLSQLNQHI
mgnify:CR=1 FL=1